MANSDFCLSYAPCHIMIMKSCQQDVSNTILAEASRLGELIGDGEQIT